MKRRLKHTVTDFDLVHLHSLFAHPTATAAHYARKHGVPYVISTRGMLVKKLVAKKSTLVKKCWITAFDRRNLEGAHAVHVTSKAESLAIRKYGFDLNEVVHIPHGVDLSGAGYSVAMQKMAIKRALDARSRHSKPLVLFIGRLSPIKGIDRLIDALGILPGVEAIVAGPDEDGYRQQLEAHAQKIGVADRVRFIGEINDNQREHYLRAASMFVLPSHSENFGIAALEAMARGVPVVVTKQVGLAQAVSEHGCGIVIDGDAASLASAIWQITHNPQRAIRLGEAGYDAVRNYYTWHRVGSRMRELYLRALRSSQHGRGRSVRHSDSRQASGWA
jgi:glycosyltransferase involved in cell wall biosynthesis